MMKCAATAAAVIFTVGTSAADGHLSAAECSVWQRELSFALTVDRHDASAFAAHIDPGAVFSAATAQPLRGRDAIVKNWGAIIAGKNVRLAWRPNYISIGENPNIAISRGPFTIENLDPSAKHRYAIGTFTSVWARAKADAPWLVVFDGGGPPPTPVASEAEAMSHLASAPKECPQG